MRKKRIGFFERFKWLWAGIYLGGWRNFRAGFKTMIRGYVWECGEEGE